MSIDIDDLMNRIKYHRPNDEAIGQIADMRQFALTWATSILREVPDGREQSLALTHIETALFWANAGIAREPDNWAADQPEK